MLFQPTKAIKTDLRYEEKIPPASSKRFCETLIFPKRKSERKVFENVKCISSADVIRFCDKREITSLRFKFWDFSQSFVSWPTRAAATVLEFKFSPLAMDFRPVWLGFPDSVDIGLDINFIEFFLQLHRERRFRRPWPPEQTAQPGRRNPGLGSAQTERNPLHRGRTNRRVLLWNQRGKFQIQAPETAWLIILWFWIVI